VIATCANIVGRALAAVALLCLSAAADAHALPRPLACEKEAAESLRGCIKSMTRVVGQCYGENGTACSDREPKAYRALQKVSNKVSVSCPDAATVAAAGFGANLTPAALASRLREACAGAASALAARSFGGPQALALTEADAGERECLLGVYAAGSNLVDETLKRQSACVLRAHRSKTCDTAALALAISELESDAVGAITRVCSGRVASLIGSDAATFVRNTSAQSGCLTATALGAPAPFDLGCGPRAAVTVPSRGVLTQVVLDEATWGTRCGDGSPYAFQLRLAPSGEPVENVVVYLHGGGFCLGDADCRWRARTLFSAVEDNMPDAGILSSDPASNPDFAKWTHVFLPYCTQDLYIGGGAVSDFPNITVHRFGAKNVRGALRYLRDVLWSELDATSPDGYRPEALRVIFTGWSAGAYGVVYNYHYLVDDLRWVHTMAVPDGALGLDDGRLNIGSAMLSDAAPSGWGSTPFMPPYCFGDTCPALPALAAAHAERLLGAPEQQILQVSNQVDEAQRITYLFPDVATWIDAVRSTYCALQGTPGLHYFLSASTASIHGIVMNDNFTTLTAGGVTLSDWLADAVRAPESVPDAVSDGTMIATYGANPFSCALAR
jgi:hypothetical protein